MKRAFMLLFLVSLLFCGCNTTPKEEGAKWYLQKKPLFEIETKVVPAHLDSYAVRTLMIHRND